MQDQLDNKYKCVELFTLDKLVEKVDAIPVNDNKYWSYKDPEYLVSCASIKKEMKSVLTRLSSHKTRDFNYVKSKLLNSRDTYEMIEPIVRKLFRATTNCFVVHNSDQKKIITFIGNRFQEGEYAICVHSKHVYGINWYIMIITNFGSIWFRNYADTLCMLHNKFPLENKDIDTIITTAQSLCDNSVEVEKICQTMESNISKLLEEISKEAEAEKNQEKVKPVDSKDDADKTDECCVCFVPIKQKLACVPCGHTTICGVCIAKINDVCPMCKVDIESTMKIY